MKIIQRERGSIKEPLQLVMIDLLGLIKGGGLFLSTSVGFTGCFDDLAVEWLGWLKEGKSFYQFCIGKDGFRQEIEGQESSTVRKEITCIV